MKRRRYSTNSKLPMRAGWYRIVTKCIEELRYFDGISWTNQTRDSPFWLEGPEWNDLSLMNIAIDSDDPRLVLRNLCGQGQHKPSGLQKFTARSKMRYYLTILFTGIVIAMILTTFILQISSSHNVASKQVSGVSLSANKTIYSKITEICKQSLPQRAPLIVSINQTLSSYPQLLATSTLIASELSDLGRGIVDINATPETLGALKMLRSKINLAALSAQTMLNSVVLHNPSKTQLYNLNLAIDQFDTLVEMNSLKSCLVFHTLSN